MINIHSYEYTFKPFSYKLSWEGRLEISSRYRVGSKILTGKAYLPNQIIDFIDIVPDNSSKCYSTSKTNCRVFRLSAFVHLSGDLYFSREFSSIEEVPVLLNLDFDTSNISSFKSYNNYFNYSTSYNNKNIALSEYIASIKLLKIDSKFKYRNSYLIERKLGWSNTWNALQIPSAWHVRNGIQSYEYKNIEVKLEDYRNLDGAYISSLFGIKGDAQVHLDQHIVYLGSGESISVPNSDIRSKNSGKWTYYVLDGGIRRVESKYLYRSEYRGILFRDKVQGYLFNKFKLLVNNHGYALTLKNHFSFKEQTIQTTISRKTDNYFRNLQKFKYIDL